MKIKKEYKVREMAGEHVVIVQGRYGADMTKLISFNATSLYLWNELQGREFDADTVVSLLTARYNVDEPTARRDAEAWIARLEECKLTE